MIEKILQFFIDLLERWIFRYTARMLGGKRDPRWTALRNRTVKEHPYCAATGLKTKLEAHHIKPAHLFPELELDPDNLIVLHRWVHFILAHLCSFHSYNLKIKEHAEWLYKLIKNRP